ALGIELVHEDVKPAVQRAQQILLRDVDVVEVDPDVVHHVPHRDFVDLTADGDAGMTHRHDERGHALVRVGAGVGDGEQHVWLSLTDQPPGIVMSLTVMALEQSSLLITRWLLSTGGRRWSGLCSSTPRARWSRCARRDVVPAQDA